MTVLAVGNRIADRYVLERQIAVGGMGEVWEAVDSRLGRSVAIKILRPELSHDEEFLHRFRIEARTVASLDHQGVAAVHDYGEDTAPGEQTAYLVMELVRGEPLSAIIARGPIDPGETLRLLEDSAHALAAAHDRGIVHRDVKPGNILVRTDGRVKLTDFGIAKAANAVPVTRAGMVMGTAHYIAPEQATGSEAGPSGDVYSLGVVAYECLTGKRPFQGDNAVEVAMMQVRDDPPPLPTHIPTGIRKLIMSILVKDPADRYADGAELATAVAALRRGDTPLAARIDNEPRPPAPVRRSAPAAPPPAGSPPSGSPPSGSPPSGSPPATPPPPVAPPSVAPPRAPSRTPGQLRIAPARNLGRTWLTVVFLLLTVIAVAAAAWYLLGRGADGDVSDPLSGGAAAGTVLSREDISTGPAASGRPFDPMIDAEGVR